VLFLLEILLPFEAVYYKYKYNFNIDYYLLKAFFNSSCFQGPNRLKCRYLLPQLKFSKLIKNFEV